MVSLISFQAFTPLSISLAADNNINVEENIEKIDILETSENSVTLSQGDELVKIEVVKNKVIISSNIGVVDTYETIGDTIYLNGEYYAESPSQENSINSRAVNPNQWIQISTSQGRTSNFGALQDLATGITGILLSSIPFLGAATTLYGIIAAIQAAFGNAPAPYYKLTVYNNLAQRKLKYVYRYYRNSNYTGYESTEVKYQNY